MKDERASSAFVKLKSLNGKQKQKRKEIVIELDVVRKHRQGDDEEEFDYSGVDFYVVVHEVKPLSYAWNGAERKNQADDKLWMYF